MAKLMLAASIAVLAFFAKNTELGTHAWQSRIAPALASVGLVIFGRPVLSNFTLVAGGSATLSTVLAAIPVVGRIAGCAIGRPRRTKIVTP